VNQTAEDLDMEDGDVVEVLLERELISLSLPLLDSNCTDAILQRSVVASR
jgi:hypothetical protein